MTMKFKVHLFLMIDNCILVSRKKFHRMYLVEFFRLHNFTKMKNSAIIIVLFIYVNEDLFLNLNTCTIFWYVNNLK